MKKYQDHVDDINALAGEVKRACLIPVTDDEGVFIADKCTRDANLTAATKYCGIFESLGEAAPVVSATWSNAIRKYCLTYGIPPSNELLASAYASARNLLGVLGDNSSRSGLVLESVADMSTTEGLLIRNKFLALVMPRVLSMITNQMTTPIPGEYNSAEIFWLERIAKSNFGTVSAGDVIDEMYTGQLGVMNRRELLATADGTATTFTTTLDFPAVKGSIKIYVDRVPVGKDNRSGSIVPIGSFGIAGTVSYNTAGTTVIQVSTTAGPLANALEIHVAADIDIEVDPTQIPSIAHVEYSDTIQPHECAIHAGVSLQMFIKARRELGVDLQSLQMAAIKNIMAASEDRNILNDLFFFANGEVEWLYNADRTAEMAFHAQAMRQALDAASTTLLNRTRKCGLAGLVVSDRDLTHITTIPGEFRHAPGYIESPQPHYVGTLEYRNIKVFSWPGLPPGRAMGYAIGSGVGESGYLAGAAVPPMLFKHPTDRGLSHEQTLWGLSFRDLHPNAGQRYFINFNFTPV